jgi:hypothetical protein
MRGTLGKSRCTSSQSPRDLSDPLGGIVSAGKVQRATLAALADRFVIVVRIAGVYAGANTQVEADQGR